MDTSQDPTALHLRPGLSDPLRVLAEEIPRNTWADHDNFGGMVQFWLERHTSFRRLLALLETDLQKLADRRIGWETYAPRLSQYGGMLLNELHGHHQIEDMHYFPRLVQLDPRLEDGFAILDKDHHALDAVINGVAEGANGLLRGGGTDPGQLEKPLGTMAHLLDRHLEDEEEIVVPVILKSGFQG